MGIIQSETVIQNSLKKPDIVQIVICDVINRLQRWSC